MQPHDNGTGAVAVPARHDDEPARRPLSSRDRLLAAATTLFGLHGVTGTTTRRVAEFAGVNEVTLFRLFGTKQALLAEALHGHLAGIVVPLPSRPVEPERELSAWFVAQVEALRQVRGVLLHCASASSLDDGHVIIDPLPQTFDAILRELMAFVRRVEAAQHLLMDSVRARCAMLTSVVMSEALMRSPAWEAEHDVVVELSRCAAGLVGAAHA